MHPVEIIIRYGSFAALAILLNLATQRAMFWLFGAALGPVVATTIAMAMGTGVGLVVKYLLDKRWIFADPSTGIANHTRKFGLYTFFGGFTTAMFWATEGSFYAIYGTHTMREVGAVIGLVTGYVLKYFLDKRFVFRESRA